jgi:hypothetical protein
MNIAQMATGQPQAGQQVEQQPVQQVKGQPVEAEGEQPTAKEQENFSRIELAAKAVVNSSKESYANIVQMLQGGADNPAQALATAAMMVFTAVDDQSKGKIPEELILRGAESALDQVIKVAEDTGTMQVSEQLAGQALQQLVMQVGESYGVDPADLQAEIEGMDKTELQALVQQQEALYAQESNDGLTG